ncbi:leucine-rich repeat domain, L domain-like protein [Artemisia annua]|uniref:Leucine-rich repeat domain, L domain-like protein n=1 Tax=Artemisia annua TaxID=35608 RepID=A0A2U1QMA9_ARTAN|nr:leucine-rich repeat domain, L domain-like protein [Artemisia annua]
MDPGVKNHNKRIRPTPQLPDDALSLIFEKIDRKVDRDSFGLACHNFLDIQSSIRRQLTPSNKVIHDSDSFIRNMLNRFRHLESLSLMRCRGLSDSGLTPLQMYGSKLKSLNLSLCLRVTDNGLSYVASGCPLLSFVSLYKCCFITDHGLQILTESCKSLKHVDLSLCSEITDNGIQCLSQNCRQLTKLWISGCDKILGKGFQGVSPTLACLEAKNCPFDSKGVSAVLSGGGLKYLNLSRDKYPREYDLAAIGLGFGAHIETLDLKNCNFVEDATITKIAQGCPLLQDWNLSGCDKITDHGWRSIGLYCQNLEILHVNGCKNFNISTFTKYQRQDVEINKEKSRQIITHNWASTTNDGPLWRQRRFPPPPKSSVP